MRGDDLTDDEWRIVLFCVEKVAVEMRRKENRLKAEQCEAVVDKIE